MAVITTMESWVDLKKNTLYIVLMLAGLFGLAIIFNIIYIIAYNCKKYTLCTVKQKILIVLLNLGALFSLATDTYYKYYEHQQWGLNGYDNCHCKMIKFMGHFGFACYVYSLVALASDSVMRIQKTVTLGKVPELRPIHFLCPLIAILIFSAVSSIIPTLGYISNRSENTMTGICEEMDTTYGYYFLMYLNFHDLLCLFFIPVIALQVIYLYSMSKFGCKAQNIVQRIEESEDGEYTEILDAQTHWLLTVKWLAIAFTIVFLPVFFSQLMLALLNRVFVTDLEVPNSIGIFVNRLTMLFKGLVALLSPLALLMRLSWKKKKPVILETNL